MGIDCHLITEKKEICLDRFYHYHNNIESNKIYIKKEILFLLLNSLIVDYKEHINKFPDLEYEINYWINSAILNLGEINVFQCDCEEKKYNVEKLRKILKEEKI